MLLAEGRKRGALKDLAHGILGMAILITGG
jgi:hypothetical protein